MRIVSAHVYYSDDVDFFYQLEVEELPAAEESLRQLQKPTSALVGAVDLSCSTQQEHAKRDVFEYVLFVVCDGDLNILFNIQELLLGETLRNLKKFGSNLAEGAVNTSARLAREVIVHPLWAAPLISRYVRTWKAVSLTTASFA